ncbi:MAG: hypothetical protein R3245_07910 [Kiloniellales bacterium]|nr:hypothetical protein [Kiloniellales bacterium]
MSRKRRSILAFAGIIALGPWVCVPPALSNPLLPGESWAEYAPMQSISYSFGSKFMSGYFVKRSDTCSVTLMVIEKGDPDESLPLSPTRVRFVLYPGQIMGLDSEEGRSLNLTCGEGATTLLVEFGEREVLVARQASATKKTTGVVTTLSYWW